MISFFDQAQLPSNHLELRNSKIMYIKYEDTLVPLVGHFTKCKPYSCSRQTTAHVKQINCKFNFANWKHVVLFVISPKQ